MRIPLSWLRDLVDVPWRREELGARLTMSGFELEALETAAPAFSGVVVAEIVEAARIRRPRSCRCARCARGEGRAAADRLRRRQCARRAQDRAGHRGRETPGRQGHHGREAARRRILRHVVLREGAGPGRDFRRHRGAAGRCAGGPGSARPTCSSTTNCSSSMSRRIAAMPCRCWASRAKWPPWRAADGAGHLRRRSRPARPDQKTPFPVKLHARRKAAPS